MKTPVPLRLHHCLYTLPLLPSRTTPFFEPQICFSASVSTALGTPNSRISPYATAMKFWGGICAPGGARSGYGTGAANRSLAAEAGGLSVGRHLLGRGTAPSETGYNWRSIAGFNDPAVFISGNVKKLSRKSLSC